MSYLVVWFPGVGATLPPKISELKADLRRAGFIRFTTGGKGSHEKWIHSAYPDRIVVVAGHDGDDSQHYLIRDVRYAVARASERSKEERS